MFLDKFDGIRYVYTWLNNKIKRLRVKCFKNKNKVSLLVFFKRYIGKFEHKYSKCIRIRINNKSKYINKVFKV